MYIMKPCLICLEETNKLFENANCKCKYNVHKTCLNQWSKKWKYNCIICKKPIIKKQSLFVKWTQELIVTPLLQVVLQIAFVPMFVVYICFMNAVYLLNVYVLDSYDQLGR